MGDYCKTVNLEIGMPTSEDAVKRLTYEIHTARRMGACALKIIHGYGSSGTGGKIRTRSRTYLESLVRRRQIKGYITGENFSIFNQSTREAFAACSSLRGDSDLERSNNGITIVLL